MDNQSLPYKTKYQKANLSNHQCQKNYFDTDENFVSSVPFHQLKKIYECLINTVLYKINYKKKLLRLMCTMIGYPVAFKFCPYFWRKKLTNQLFSKVVYSSPQKSVHFFFIKKNPPPKKQWKVVFLEMERENKSMLNFMQLIYWIII